GDPHPANRSGIGAQADRALGGDAGAPRRRGGGAEAGGAEALRGDRREPDAAHHRGGPRPRHGGRDGGRAARGLRHLPGAAGLLGGSSIPTLGQMRRSLIGWAGLLAALSALIVLLGSGSGAAARGLGEPGATKGHPRTGSQGIAVSVAELAARQQREARRTGGRPRGINEEPGPGERQQP